MKLKMTLDVKSLKRDMAAMVEKIRQIKGATRRKLLVSAARLPNGHRVTHATYTPGRNLTKEEGQQLLRLRTMYTIACVLRSQHRRRNHFGNTRVLPDYCANARWSARIFAAATIYQHIAIVGKGAKEAEVKLQEAAQVLNKVGGAE